MSKRKFSNWQIALGQAIAVVVYVALVAWFMASIGESIQPPAYIGIAVMLTLLVFSAAFTGSLIFGYPVYLALHKKYLDYLN